MVLHFRVASAYQSVTTPTLSNFQGEAIGYGVILGFPVVFHITPGRRYVIVLTLDASNNIVLLLGDEGAVSTSSSGSVTFEESIGVRPEGGPAIRFAPR
jgi:hypothetical protein